MDDPQTKLRQFNEVWDGRRLFTACIDFMFWYELADNVKDGMGLPEIENSYWLMIEPIRSRISYFSKDESSKRSKPKRDTLDLYPHSLRQTRSDSIGGINQITLLNGAERDKSDIFFDAHLTTFSYQRFGLSIEEVLAAPEAFVHRCLRSVDGVKFKSGIGGYSMNYEDVYINGNDQLCAPIIGRFPGVNVIHPWRYRDLDGVPTINWLTLVSTADIDRLGGWDALVAQLQPPVLMHRLPHGALLQAGPRPLLGDVNEQEYLDAYHAVGRLLAPVKSTQLVESKVVDNDRQASNQWMHRFSRPRA